jgi:hypothetical protein
MKYEITAFFEELNLENQEILLACARVSRTAENAVREQCNKSIKQETGLEYVVASQDTQEGVSFPK